MVKYWNFGKLKTKMEKTKTKKFRTLSCRDSEVFKTRFDSLLKEGWMLHGITKECITLDNTNNLIVERVLVQSFYKFEENTIEPKSDEHSVDYDLAELIVAFSPLATLVGEELKDREDLVSLASKINQYIKDHI